MSISGSGRGAFKRSVWRDSIRVIAVVNAEPVPLRPRHASWRPRVRVLRTVRPTGAAIGWPKLWALAASRHRPLIGPWIDKKKPERTVSRLEKKLIPP